MHGGTPLREDGGAYVEIPVYGVLVNSFYISVLSVEFYFLVLGGNGRTPCWFQLFFFIFVIICIDTNLVMSSSNILSICLTIQFQPIFKLAKMV